MNIKSLTLLIAVSILIGFLIFKLTGNKFSQVEQIVTKKIIRNQISIPSPSPTLKPLEQNSNLDEEINKLSPADFSEDFADLRKQVSNF
ncbi:hypothetical protein HYS93_01795 [Candidatus Daviesbacteria bacterium]|nr:hypothetical protein [Candidatus Daviesbacteria bacterium]